MKKYMTTGLLSLGISLVVVAGYHFSGVGQRVITIEEDAAIPTVTTSLPTYTADEVSTMPPDFRIAATKTMQAVVHIKSIKTYTRRRSSVYEELFGWGTPSNERRNVSTGSGVIISSDGYIATNNHVIENADELEVSLFDGRNYKATVVGTDPSTDLGLIKIEDTRLPKVNFADSDGVMVGEWVLAVGNPFNLASTATAGIVSAIGRNLEIIKDEMAIEAFIQTDAAVNPGNSGGALVDLNGNLVGINTAIASPTGSYAGYAFAVPANIVGKVVEDLKQYGRVQRGFIGISYITNLNPNIAREKGLDIDAGVIVERLAQKSAAGDAGIRTGDVIVAIDGIRVRSDSKLLELVSRKRPGDYVEVRVNRRGDYRTFNVQLTDQDGSTAISAPQRNELFNELGVELESVSPGTLRSYGINQGGIKVKKLFAGKIRRDTELKEGFVILSVNGEEVDSESDFVQKVKRSRGKITFEGVYPGRSRYYHDYTIEM